MGGKSQLSQKKSSQNFRRSQATQSQRSISGSQESLNGQQEGDVNVEEQVNDLVRYIVNRAGEQTIFKRTDLNKNVLKQAGSNYQRIINEATKVLKNVYGYNLILLDGAQNSTKTYIVTNALPYIVDRTEPQQDEYPDDVNKILLLLVLSHIFMSNNPITEASLHSFLRSLQINIDQRHELFGNVKDCIYIAFKNKKYLNIEINEISKKPSFSWGPRAEKEISKMDILKFVCKIYKDRQPSSWINQKRIANNQQLETLNEQEVTENCMEH